MGFGPQELTTTLPYCHTEICQPESLDDARYANTRNYILIDIDGKGKLKICNNNAHHGAGNFKSGKTDDENNCAIGNDLRNSKQCQSTNIQRIMSIADAYERDFQLRALVQPQAQNSKEIDVISSVYYGAFGSDDLKHTPQNMLKNDECGSSYLSVMNPPDNDYIMFNINDFSVAKKQCQSLVITKMFVLIPRSSNAARKISVYIGDVTNNQWEKLHKNEIELHAYKEHMIEVMFVVGNQQYIKLEIDSNWGGKHNQICEFKVSGVIV